MAERMFYFLEATEAEPLCRACLGQEAPPVLVPRKAPRPAPPLPAEPQLVLPDDPPASAAFEGVLLDAIRFFLAEELRRCGLTIARMPPDESRVRAARDLHNETEWLLQLDRVREAMESLRDLRTIVYALETSEMAGHGSVPRSPDEPTIEELYDRVLRRASVLSARLRADLESNWDSLGGPGALPGSAVTEKATVDVLEPPSELAEVPVRVPRRCPRT